MLLCALPFVQSCFTSPVSCHDPGHYSSGCGDITGYRWCVRAQGANGTASDHESVLITNPNGTWVSACDVVCHAVHTILLAGKNGELGPGDPGYPEWQYELATLREAATQKCEARAAVLEMDFGTIVFDGAPDDLSCADAAAQADA